MSQPRVSDFLDDVVRYGRHHFTLAEAAQAVGGSTSAVRQALARVKKKREVAEPVRGFFVVVTPPYRRLGAPPAKQFIDQLMGYLGRPYYVGLLSAAAYHGAAHHRPQVFQVVTDANLRPINCGDVRIEFIADRNVGRAPVEIASTDRGYIRYSSPAATAMDLISHLHRAGGLDNVATVLAELAEVIDPAELVEVARSVAMARVQRLGHLLEDTGTTDKFGPLQRYVADREPQVTPLDPGRPMHGAPRDERWRVAVNVEVEAEL